MVVNEIRLGRKETLERLLVKGLIALAVLWIVLFMLPGCGDGTYEQQQLIAERNARFFNSCLPEVKQPMVVEWKKGQLICYPKGVRRQPTVVADMNVDYD